MPRYRLAAMLLNVGLLLTSAVLLAMAVSHPAAKQKIAELSDDPSDGLREALAASAAMEKWKQRHGITEGRMRELFTAYETRRSPAVGTLADWWCEAKDKTPAEMDEIYPPLHMQEWFRASWPSYHSRRLITPLGLGKDEVYELIVSADIRTPPGVPIKKMYGTFKVMKGGSVLCELPVAEEPDLSFSDGIEVKLTLIPYKDDLPTHRALRHNRNDELTPVFTVKRVVLADGTEKTY